MVPGLAPGAQPPSPEVLPPMLRAALALTLLVAVPAAALEVYLAGETFTLEVADTPELQARGLMGRTSVGPRGGMLFAYPDDAVRAFWMKDCLTDLDLVYLDREQRVVSTHRMRREPPRGPDESQAVYQARLPVYVSADPARYALEFAPGTLARLRVSPGDRVTFGPSR